MKKTTRLTGSKRATMAAELTRLETVATPTAEQIARREALADTLYPKTPGELADLAWARSRTEAQIADCVTRPIDPAMVAAVEALDAGEDFVIVNVSI